MNPYPTTLQFPSWDLQRALQALTRPPFEPLRSVSLHMLSIEVVFLVAITSARRVSELAALSTTTQTGTQMAHVRCEAGTPNLHQAVFRKIEAMFVSFHLSTLGNKMTSATLGRWIRACIAKAYQTLSVPVPRHITAHSTRSAATSAAWATQASLEEICRVATWISLSPFIRHYCLDSFASAQASCGPSCGHAGFGMSHSWTLVAASYNYLRTPFLSTLQESPAPPCTSGHDGQGRGGWCFYNGRLSLMTSEGDLNPFLDSLAA
ncbi:hypothetical protein L345_07119, partial [Ophiophagus hannah]